MPEDLESKFARVDRVIAKLEYMEKGEEHRTEISRWIVGIMLALAMFVGAAAGRLTSQWLDFNAELRDIRERLVIVETEARLVDPRSGAASGKSVVGAGTEAE